MALKFVALLNFISSEFLYSHHCCCCCCCCFIIPLFTRVEFSGGISLYGVRPSLVVVVVNVFSSFFCCCLVVVFLVVVLLLGSTNGLFQKNRSRLKIDSQASNKKFSVFVYLTKCPYFPTLTCHLISEEVINCGVWFRSRFSYVLVFISLSLVVALFLQLLLLALTHTK